MKDLKDIIIEKLRINKDTKVICAPANVLELRKILEKRLEKDKNADLNDIDVSNIKNFGKGKVDNNSISTGLFEGLDPHNIKIDKWDMSNATVVSNMFYKCKNLQCDVSNWNVSNVKFCNWMFAYCDKFNCDLSKWDTSNVIIANGMFIGCLSFEGKGLENWDVSNVEYMNNMFYSCEKLDFDGTTWNNANKAKGNRISTFENCISMQKLPDWAI